jgi:sugar (pentulose or hexulose) kinase
MASHAAIVLDIGKSMSKAALWDAEGQLIAKRSRPNQRIETGEYLALDAANIEEWLVETLREFAKLAQVSRIIPVSHGAGAALVQRGKLRLPPLDYEHPIPTSIRQQYEATRDPFSVTGSPSLPDGLNLGAQLHYLQRLHPDAFAASTQIMPWAQYWSWLLSGVGCSEVTSLGCHTDLWSPVKSTYSPLAVSRGWADLMAPLRRAGEALGPILPEWCAKTGLPANTVIHCGLHDSNAALLAARGFPQIASGEATVLSTGTWFVSMRTPQDSFVSSSLPEGRDCLINVDAFNRMIPSSRFMGGREIELSTGIDARRIDIKPDQPALLAALDDVVQNNSMLLPTLVPGTGPFPHHQARWLSKSDEAMQQRAAVGLYAALLADASLDLIGARELVLIEGRFSESEIFVRSLAALRSDMRLYTANVHSDVSYGTFRLMYPTLPPLGELQVVEGIQHDLREYRARWRAQIEQTKAVCS